MNSMQLFKVTLKVHLQLETCAKYIQGYLLEFLVRLNFQSERSSK